MYGRSAVGSVLPLVGLAAAPEMIPGIPVARALQATAGAGFLLYCLIVLGLLLARIRLRARPSATGSRAPGAKDLSAVDRT